MKMKILDHALLLTINDSSMRSERRQNLRPERLAGKQQARYYITEHFVGTPEQQQEVRVCVVLDLYTGQTSWLDMSYDEFASVPELEIPDDEWETAMCAGTPPAAP